jgi:hypothetical protein
MKTLIAFAFVLALSSVSALAADGKVSHSSLSKMGLSGMRQMTDREGSSIRGQAAVLYPPQPIIGRIDRILFAELRAFYPPTPVIGRSGR